MARIRSVKPEFFKHADLYDLEEETGLPIRLAFAGIWTLCDREGRFKWKPREMKLDVLPYDSVDFSRVLDALVTRGYLVKYEVGGKFYGFVPTFHDHQQINGREAQSVLPAPPEGIENKQEIDTTSTCQPHVNDASTTRADVTQGEGKGREGKGKEGIESDSHFLVGSSETDPLKSAVEAYNAAASIHEWPACKKLTPARKSSLRQRLNDAEGIDGWKDALARAGRSDFLTGRRGNDRNWRPDFDFFLQQKRFTKLIEGGYDNPPGQVRAGGYQG